MVAEHASRARSLAPIKGPSPIDFGVSRREMAARVAAVIADGSPDQAVIEATANDMISTFLDQIAEAVTRGERVNLRGFGVFVPRDRKPVHRKGAVDCDVPARTIVAFLPSDKLKARINQEAHDG